MKHLSKDHCHSNSKQISKHSKQIVTFFHQSYREIKGSARPTQPPRTQTHPRSGHEIIV